MSHNQRIKAWRNLDGYFQSAVASALDNQQVEADDSTIYYLVQVLSHFARAENLFNQSSDGVVLKPLAGRLAEAQHAQSTRERSQALREMGDFALFFAGFFAGYFSRRLVDVDYYIGMGGSAYATLYNEGAYRNQGLIFADIFRELSEKFADFVDIIAEVGENRDQFSSADILRLYEIWLKTGSHRVAKKLQGLGIHPVPASESGRSH